MASASATAFKFLVLCLLGGIDVVFGLMIFAFVLPAFGHFLKDEKEFGFPSHSNVENNKGNEVAIYGVIFLSSVGLGWFLNGLRISYGSFNKLRGNLFPFSHRRFAVLIFFEIVGFLSPFLIFKDYQLQVSSLSVLQPSPTFDPPSHPAFRNQNYNYVDTLTKIMPNQPVHVQYDPVFGILALLLINSLTIALFLYQLTSALLVYTCTKSLVRGQSQSSSTWISDVDLHCSPNPDDPNPVLEVNLHRCNLDAAQVSYLNRNSPTALHSNSNLELEHTTDSSSEPEPRLHDSAINLIPDVNWDTVSVLNSNWDTVSVLNSNWDSGLNSDLDSQSTRDEEYYLELSSSPEADLNRDSTSISIPDSYEQGDEDSYPSSNSNLNSESKSDFTSSTENLQSKSDSDSEESISDSDSNSRLSINLVSNTDSDSDSSDCSSALSSKRKTFLQLKRKCLKSKYLFRDPDFPANDESLQIQMKSRRLKWLRPYEISKNCRFFCHGVSRFDANQGELGNCWFLAALDNLTLNSELFEQVVPQDNCWGKGLPYVGICHFRFWVNKKWTEVVIDDRLPTQNGQLVFMQSNNRNEFWSSLLEKAYAKLYGSYQNLDGGRIGTAMMDLTGGCLENLKVKKLDMDSATLFRKINEALANGSLLGCSIFEVQVSETKKCIEGKGLLAGHAYSITSAKQVKTRSQGITGLIRIRNPWGNIEWTGDWSDGHYLWDEVDKKTRCELEVIFKNDGEFWFPIDEFSKYFDKLTICYIGLI